MRNPKSILFILGFIVVLIFQVNGNSYAQDKLPPIFKESFDKGLDGWHKEYKEGSIEIVTTAEGNKYLKISKDSRRGFTYISRDFVGYKGTLEFVANIKFDNVVRGNHNFHRGKFQAVVYVDGRDVDYPDADFEGTSPWMPRRFKVFDLTGKETVVLRIGLQDAKGTIFVDDIEVYNIR